jgi:single-strand DNA-binding protein
MINRVVLVGNLTRDPQYSKTQSGISLARFSVAINRRYGQNEEVDYINCVAWRQSADFLNQYAKKGNTIAVEGRISTRNYDDPNTGKKVYVTEVTADSVQLIGSRQNRDTATTAPSQGSNPGYFADQSAASDEEFNTGPLLDISSDDLPF